MTLIINQIINDADNKSKDEFRNYEENNALFQRVFNTYKLMHTNQTVNYVKQQHKKWLNFDHAQMTIMDAIDLLCDFVDESDPDVDFANRYHAFQTAEGVRKMHPDKDWLIFTGFIHDLGKFMGMRGQPQWSTVGDTFPVGCRPGKTIVYGDSTFGENEDFSERDASKENEVYKDRGCLGCWNFISD